MSLKTQTLSQVTAREEFTPGLVTLRFLNPNVARTVQAGQFVNVLPRVGLGDPMLRRPFSIHRTLGDEAEIIVQVTGRGTELIGATQVGEMLDVLGPLGQPWNYKSQDYTTAVLVIGGVGVASMPLLTAALTERDIPVQSYYGARNGALFVTHDLVNLHCSTDDGSIGFHGSNIALLRHDLIARTYKAPKLFVCGPTGMMRAAQALAAEFDIPCELSLETEMACGIGICQGCPVETDAATYAETGKRFRLVCTEGPSFAADKIVLR